MTKKKEKKVASVFPRTKKGCTTVMAHPQILKN